MVATVQFVRKHMLYKDLRYRTLPRVRVTQRRSLLVINSSFFQFPVCLPILGELKRDRCADRPIMRFARGAVQIKNWANLAAKEDGIAAERNTTMVLAPSSRERKE